MKKSKLVLALTAILPGIAVSAPPVAFDAGWSLNADGVTIDHVCPTGFTCDSAPIADSNFLQVQMTRDSDGETFFRTIIATDDGTDVYKNESFVVSGATAGGISANQSLNSNQAGSGILNASTTLNTGSFNGGGAENQVELSQGVWDPAAGPTFHSGFNFTKNSAGTQSTTVLDQQIVETGEFSDSFSYNQDKDISGATDVVLSTKLDIVSGVVLNTTGGAVTDQAFRYSLREGTDTTGPGTATLPGLPAGSDTVTWVNGNSVERVLVGQSVTDAGDFGYERVANSTTATEITDFSLAALAPLGTITGSDPFGAPGDPGAIVVAPVTP